MIIMNRKRLIALIGIAIAIAIINATVFVYYLMQINVSTVPPPIIFSLGSNANKPDLGTGNTIMASISNANTSLDITVHPTYQTNYYKDIARIVNLDTSKSYYIYVKVSDPLSPGGNLTSAKLIIRDAGGTVASIDIDSTSTTPIYVGSLSANSQWSIDLKLVLSNVGSGTYSQAPKITDNSAKIELIYSLAQETPP